MKISGWNILLLILLCHLMLPFSLSSYERMGDTLSLLTFAEQPGPPALVSPENDSSVANQWPDFSWTLDSEPANFTLQLSTSIDFNDSNAYSFTEINAYSFKPSEAFSPFPETPPVKWYWRVQNVNESGAGMFSDVWCFYMLSFGPPPVDPAYIALMIIVPVAVIVLCTGGLYYIKRRPASSMEP